MKSEILYITLLLTAAPVLGFTQQKYHFEDNNKTLVIVSASGSYKFTGGFSVIYSAINPDMALRPAGVKGINYNVPSWKIADGRKADLKTVASNASVGGDGWDNNIIKGDTKGRTPNVFSAGEVINMMPQKAVKKGDSTIFIYQPHPLFELTAKMVTRNKGYPELSYRLTPKQKGYFSIGYTGAQQFEQKDIKELWQPLIWQEKRFPDNVFMTPAYLAPLPATLVNDGINTIGVMAASEYMPFDPLPRLINSKFGVVLRDSSGKARSQVFAPIPGGLGSLMNKGELFNFRVVLIVEPASLTASYEKIARNYFGFRDYRRNDIATLNEAMDNITDYAMTSYAWYVDSLKGYSYATDAPGSVKNVSSLHPLELSLVMDNEKMFDKRAYPMMEFMLSRERTLFALDTNQKIQNPSRKLRGSAALLSELTTLYRSLNETNPVLKEMAVEKYEAGNKKMLKDGRGGNWLNDMQAYKVTGKNEYLQKAIQDADRYVAERVNTQQTGFEDPYSGGFFFRFTSRWTELLELYELTGKKTYLDAAWAGARNYAMYVWMGPAIPDSMITVNKGGLAPMYSYVKSKGHKQMYYPEEKAPAWRLSEIGLLAESTGTSASHRGIFMANHAPWMLKLGFYKNDPFLKELAKAAIIGRYRSFPGYHINTARTTAYEKFDFPLHSHTDQSVNSFHYNHILPMASMLLDYMVTDAFVRSGGKINFPSEFIEGYGYLQNRFYGTAKGSFYNEKDLQLWMPARLLNIQNKELNYISARRGNAIYIAFMNQSSGAVSTTVLLKDSLVKVSGNANVLIYKNEKWEKQGVVSQSSFGINVPSNGLTVVKLENVQPLSSFQDKMITDVPVVQNDFKTIAMGNAKGMILRFGNYTSKAYVYLQDDDAVFSKVSMNYTLRNGSKGIVTVNKYPYEFTIDLPVKNPYISFELTGVKKEGGIEKSKPVTLGTLSK